MISVLELARQHRDEVLLASPKTVYISPIEQPAKQETYWERLERICPSPHLYRIQMK